MAALTLTGISGNPLANTSLTGTLAGTSLGATLAGSQGFTVGVLTPTPPNNATVTIAAGDALTGGGTFTTDQASNSTITINHEDVSSAASLSGLTGAAVISEVTVDTYGHTTGLAQRNLTLSDLGFNASAYLASTLKGANNGVAELDSNGLVPTSQLPSYVDDVLEYANFASFPGTGEAGKIYVDLALGDIYRWGGSSYIQVNDAVSTADQATQLATARTIELTGDVTGSTTFDGSGDVQISTTSASGGGVPSGTTMLFQQSAAPTGWTKQTTHNNKALRVVSGTASSGGSVAFTTAFSTSRTVSGSVQNHTLTLSQIPSHNHGAGTLEAESHNHDMDHGHSGSTNLSSLSWNNHNNRFATSSGGFDYAYNLSAGSSGSVTINDHNGNTGNSGDLDVSGSTSNAGSGGSHNHGWSGDVNVGVQYVDLIIATKD